MAGRLAALLVAHCGIDVEAADELAAVGDGDVVALAQNRDALAGPGSANADVLAAAGDFAVGADQDVGDAGLSRGLPAARDGFGSAGGLLIGGRARVGLGG